MILEILWPNQDGRNPFLKNPDPCAQANINSLAWIECRCAESQGSHLESTYMTRPLGFSSIQRIRNTTSQCFQRMNTTLLIHYLTHRHKYGMSCRHFLVCLSINRENFVNWLHLLIKSRKPGFVCSLLLA